MAVLSQDQIALQMLYQLRVFDPSVSAEIGTPERKLLDTFAQALAEAQVSLTGVSGGLDLSAKYGTALDNFLALFGFGRQQGAYATGFVTFGRPTPSSYDITIPNGTQVSATINIASQIDGGSAATSTVVFRTTSAVTLPAGQTGVTTPIQALLPGTQGNVSANVITSFANVGAPPPGITTVANPLATSNGADAESDVELKARFKNTVFRNLAGTSDQYLALAISTQFTTKANVIGPISRYQEYLQVPSVDDSQTTLDGSGNGSSGNWTTIPSSNPYSKYVYTGAPYFLSNGGINGVTTFYRQDTDFVMNAPPLFAGDTYREYNDPDAGSPDITNPAATPNNPNVTLFNVYTGTDATVQLPRPNDVALFEYSYTSTESRNDITRNITNCVDVYINGENPTTADAIIPVPNTGTNVFTNSPTAKFYASNFRRIGLPDTKPSIGHIFTGLFWQPVLSLPSEITVGSYTYLLGTHYWAIEDKTLIGNTVRTRNGIEWDPTVNGMASGDPLDGPYTGQPITNPGTTSVTITGYTYDQNIIDLQAALDGSKQITTDVLAHRSTTRYFKLDITVVYSSGASIGSTNTAIQTTVASYLDGQYFGTLIQLSDLLVTIRNVSGVQNVRWTNDVPNPAENDDGVASLFRITECDSAGNPRSGSPDPYRFNADFYLRDSEVPALPIEVVSGDTLPGLIIRPRAQSTFNLV